MKKTALILAATLGLGAGASAQTATAERPYLPAKIQEGVILHCFVWPLQDIIAELPNIAASGFCAVQISPMQAPNIAGQPWYYTYGPCDYRFYDSVLCTREDLRELCTKADEYGIKIIMDIAANHLVAENPNDPWPAPDQHTNPWWFEEEGRCIRVDEQGHVGWDSRWSFTHQNIFGHEVKTDRADVQQRMIEYLDDLYSLGVRGVRWDSCKHIGVPSEGDDFWETVLGERDNMWTYGEVLGDIDYAPELITEYTKYMSVTDSWFDWHGANHYLSHANVPRNKCVLWAESHDTYSNEDEGSRRFDQAEIDRMWAMTASRVGASALYFSRPSKTVKDEIKLAVKGSTNFTKPEVAEVNKFHNIMGSLPETVRWGAGWQAVCRQKGAVIVADKEGPVSVGSANLDEGYEYVDQVTGSPFTLTGGVLSGTVGPTRIAVVYDARALKRPECAVTIAPASTVFSTETATYTLTTTGTDKGTYSVDGAPAVAFTNTVEITVGEGVPFESEIKIDWTAGEGELLSTGTFMLRKLQELDNYVYMRSDVDFSNLNVYCYLYSLDGKNNGNWPGMPMSFDANITIDGKTGWWKYSIPQDLAREGYAMVSTSGTYRYPGPNDPGILLNGKSLAFEYTGGEWTTHVPGTVTGIEAAEVQPADTPTEYYTPTGLRLPAAPTAPGLYIRHQGPVAEKILVR